MDGGPARRASHALCARTERPEAKMKRPLVPRPNIRGGKPEVALVSASRCAAGLVVAMRVCGIPMFTHVFDED
jgi:hypothetical protein